MQIGFPFRIDGRGLTAAATAEQHVRSLMEQILFTVPGERVNRPTFGSGVMQLVFAPNSAELAAATQFLVQSSLQEWLSHLIELEEVTVSAIDARLEVTVRYLVRQTQEQKSATLVREVTT